MKRKFYILLLLIVAFSVQSCIKYGADKDCAGELRIFFRVDVSARSVGTRAISADEIKQIDLFAFDANTKIFKAFARATNVQLSEDFYMTLPIGPGNYTFVAWSNVNDCFLPSDDPSTLEGKTYDQLMVLLDKDDNGVVTTDLHPLIFGNLKNQNVASYGAQNFTIGLVKNTYTITVKTSGLPVSGDTYSLTITDQNGKLNFDNNIASSSSEVITYTTTCTLDENSMPTATLNVMRLVAGRYIPTIVLRNETSGTELANKDLIAIIEDMLSKVAGATLDNTHEFVIELVFDGNVLTDIKINGWAVKIEQPEEL